MTDRHPEQPGPDEFSGVAFDKETNTFMIYDGGQLVDADIPTREEAYAILRAWEEAPLIEDMH